MKDISTVVEGSVGGVETKVICDGCGELIEVGALAYEVRSGYIDESGEFVRAGCVSQHFHIGRCLNSED